MDSKQVIINIQSELTIYLNSAKLKSLVIGVSGGIDSCLCCALARPVCDKLGVKLIGRSLPIQTNKLEEIARADLVGKAFCTDYCKVDLEPQYKSLLEIDKLDDERNFPEGDVQMKIREGNIKARIRMIYLYNLAHKFRGMVLSTDNLTEYMLGFWTLHGDVGDYGMIQSLWKTEVYELSQYMADNSNMQEKQAIQVCIDAVPTDGLGITNSDLDQLGKSTYKEVDETLKDCVEKDRVISDFDDPVVLRHFNSRYKRSNPCNIPREAIIDINMNSKFENER